MLVLLGRLVRLTCNYPLAARGDEAVRAVCRDRRGEDVLQDVCEHRRGLCAARPCAGRSRIESDTEVPSPALEGLAGGLSALPSRRTPALSETRGRDMFSRAWTRDFASTAR